VISSRLSLFSVSAPLRRSSKNGVLKNMSYPDANSNHPNAGDKRFAAPRRHGRPRFGFAIRLAMVAGFGAADPIEARATSRRQFAAA